ncbi:threonine synthase [Candidatus Bathyarchaeota archaeon]|nr:threonine synthase [Candidatus Bathyarchaeota archaeon]
MKVKARIQCIIPSCSKRYNVNEMRTRCDCGNLLDIKYEGNFSKKLCEVFYDRRNPRGNIFNESGVWRFRELINFINVDSEDYDKYSKIFVSFDGAEGRTRPYEMIKVAKYVDMPPGNVFFQPEGLNPSGSFKDNGISTGLTHAKMLGVKEAICASTGNTSASLAMYAANEGIKATIYVPKGKIAPGKLSQAFQFSADIFQVEGNFDDALRVVLERGVRGAYVINSVNPFRLEGQKTMVYRILEYFDWESPDWIVFPRGNMGNCSAFGKAIMELYKWGWIKKIPRFVSVDAAGTNTFFKMYNGLYRDEKLRWNGGEVNDELIDNYYKYLDKEKIKPKTSATAIQIGRPVNIKKGLRSLDFTDGISTQVTDKEMEDGVAIVGSNGFDCEQASAACVAAIKKLVKDEIIRKDDKVVGILTGRLKDSQMIVSYRSNSKNQFANPPKTYKRT